MNGKKADGTKDTRKKKKASLPPLLKYLSLGSFTGYNIYIVISLFLSLIQSLFYLDPNFSINYTISLCVVQAYSVGFFLMGKFCMYVFFMGRVYYSFEKSSLGYPKKLLTTITTVFFAIMGVIGSLYMYSLYNDFTNLGNISEPIECLSFTGSTMSTIIIYCGATFDSLWSITCLLLFVLRLKKLMKMMDDIRKVQQQRSASIGNSRDRDTRKKSSSNRNKNNNNNNNNNNSNKHNNTRNIDENNYNNSNIYNNQQSLNGRPIMIMDQASNGESTLNRQSGHASDDETATTAMTAMTGTTLTMTTTNLKTLTTTSVLDRDHDNKYKSLRLPDNINISDRDTATNSDREQDMTQLTQILTVSTATGRFSGPASPSPKSGSGSPPLTSGSPVGTTDPEQQALALALTTISMGPNGKRNLDGNSNKTNIRANDDNESGGMETVPLEKGEDKGQGQGQGKVKGKGEKRKRGRKERNSMQSFSISSKILRKRKKQSRKKAKYVDKFVPLMLKMTILSFWCAVSTFTLGYTLWIQFPTLSGVVDSTINSLCMYLSFKFAEDMYNGLCGCCLFCQNDTCIQLKSVGIEKKSIKQTIKEQDREKSKTKSRTKTKTKTKTKIKTNVKGHLAHPSNNDSGIDVTASGDTRTKSDDPTSEYDSKNSSKMSSHTDSGSRASFEDDEDVDVDENEDEDDSQDSEYDVPGYEDDDSDDRRQQASTPVGTVLMHKISSMNFRANSDDMAGDSGDDNDNDNGNKGDKADKAADILNATDLGVVEADNKEIISRQNDSEHRGDGDDKKEQHD